jgi:hypothetical protein
MKAKPKKSAKKVSIPKVGDDIYVDTSLYLSHGPDDFQGGLCKVSRVYKEISAGKPTVFVVVKEGPGHDYNWEYLAERQAELKKEFGRRCGRWD